jgi:hypothetical protein
MSYFEHFKFFEQQIERLEYGNIHINRFWAEFGTFQDCQIVYRHNKHFRLAFNKYPVFLKK